MDDNLSDFGCSQHRRKRTHSRMENDGGLSPPWERYRRLPDTNDSDNASSSHPHLAGLHLPSFTHRHTPSPPPARRRFAGDGMDYRRPVQSTRPTPSEPPHPVIDLTSDDAGPSMSQNRPRPAAPSTSRAQRPPRFSREIIDLEDDSFSGTPRSAQEPIPVPDSPEVQFISERRIHPPRAPPIHTQLQGIEQDIRRIEHTLGDDVRIYASRRMRDLNIADILNHGLAHRIAIRFTQQEPVPPPRAARRGRAPNTAGFRVPQEMGYDVVAFDLGFGGDDSRPATPTYEAPPAAPEGFTRSPADGDVLVCPNCGDELCVGSTDVKRQVWLVKACGHVYCGDCATNRKSSRSKGKQKATSPRPKPFKVCMVEGCEKKVSHPNTMIQIFL